MKLAKLVSAALVALASSSLGCTELSTPKRPNVILVGLSSESYDGPGLSLLDTEARAKGMQSFSEADGRCALRRALVTARHKYIYTPSDEIQALLRQDAQFFDDTCPRACRNLPIEELYDLQEDPFEKQNLLEGQLDEERAARLSWFRLEMAKHLNLEPFYSKTVVTEPSQSLDPAENQDLIESLRTLGYIQ